MLNGSFKSNSLLNKVKAKLNPFNLVIKTSSGPLNNHFQSNTQLSKLQMKQKKFIYNILQNKDSINAAVKSSKILNKLPSSFKNQSPQDICYSYLKDNTKPIQNNFVLKSIIETSFRFKKERKLIDRTNKITDFKINKKNTFESKLTTSKGTSKIIKKRPNKYNLKKQPERKIKQKDIEDNYKKVKQTDLFGEDMNISLDFNSIGDIWDSLAKSSVGISTIDEFITST